MSRAQPGRRAALATERGITARGTATVLAGVVAGIFASLATSSHLRAQTDRQLAVEFDRVHEQLQRAKADERERLTRQLSSVFLRLPDGRTIGPRLALGVRATFDAGRVELALQSATPPEESGNRADPDLLAAWRKLSAQDLATVQLVRLQATARLDQLVAFTQVATKLRKQGLGDVVDQALQREESRLLPLAAKALLTRDRPAGRQVFAWLADLEPAQSYRIANFALCLRQIGDLEAAFAVYERGKRVAPKDLELWNDYGLILRAVGRREEALAAFRRSVALDLERPEELRGKGPGITNLIHYEVLYPGPIEADPMPKARIALEKRPHATMLRRLTLDLQLDRLCAGRAGGERDRPGGRPAVAEEARRR